jgi:hypothetical protein
MYSIITYENNKLIINPPIDIEKITSNFSIQGDVYIKKFLTDGVLHNDKDGLLFSNKIVNNDILDKTINSDKLVDNINLTGTPTISITPSQNDNSNKIVNSEYVNTLLTNLKGDVPNSLNTLQKISEAINNDDNFYTKLAYLSGASFLGNVNLKKFSFENQVIKFRDINSTDYIIDNNNITNFRLLNGVNSITLPRGCEDGQNIYIQNSSEDGIYVHSYDKMYHLILTPITGSLDIIINPNITINLIFNKVSNFWSIIV